MSAAPIDLKAKRRETLPLIRLKLGELPAAVAACNETMAARSTAAFVFGEMLVTIETVDGRAVTVPATPTRIVLELARIANFERVLKSEADGTLTWRSCHPPKMLAETIASEPGGWRVPVLTGLTEVPILCPDGSVVTKPGYDPATKLFLHGGPFAEIDDDPAAALAVLDDAIDEFPFVKPHHRSGALALLLTSVCRRMLPAAPLFGISAREAGSGKGALATLAAIMATGCRGAETPWPIEAEEQRKSITSALLAGSSVLTLDNITEPLDSSALCVLLTAETWDDRLLGVNRRVRLPTRLLTCATGNNLLVVGDLCRRVLPIEMDAKLESPELRRFKRELVPWAIANRQKLVAAALTVLSAYLAAGAPLNAKFRPLGSFEAWSKLVCGALVWLGKPDPRAAMDATRANDPKRLLLSQVLGGIQELFGNSEQSVGNIYTTAKDASDPKAPTRGGRHLPLLWEAIEAITVKARNETSAKLILSHWLDAHKGRVVDGLRLEADRDSHAKVNRWRSECLRGCG